MRELKTIEFKKDSANRDLDLILQAVHDLRSPLGVLKILIARFEKSAPCESRELIAAVFERIENISARLVTEARLGRELSSLSQAVHAVLKEKSVEFEERVQFTSKISPEAAAFPVDACEFMRAISNLINNSVQAGARSVSVEVRKYEGSIQLSIVDDGKGFSPQAISDFNSGIAHLLASSGRGFGLRHAKQLAASLNGSLWLRSTPLCGSCVTLAFPAF